MQSNSGTQKVKSAEHPARLLSRSLRRIFTYFVNGLIIIIPLAVTLWILIWVFNLVDGMLGPLLNLTIGHHIPGLGFAIIIVCIFLIGYVGATFGRRKAFDFMERNVTRIPIVGAIYGGTRQILESFSTASKSKFMQVIFMEFPRKGAYTVGFVTSQVTDRNGKRFLNVFVPTVPNPVGGFLQIVPESDVVKTDMSMNDAMKLIISAGNISRKDIADMLSQVPKPGSKGTVLET